MATNETVKICACIGCGCTDKRACLDDYGRPCHWLKVDRDKGDGVCSECTEFLPAWDEGR